MRRMVWQVTYLDSIVLPSPIIFFLFFVDDLLSRNPTLLLQSLGKFISILV